MHLSLRPTSAMRAASSSGRRMAAQRPTPPAARTAPQWLQAPAPCRPFAPARRQLATAAAITDPATKLTFADEVKGLKCLGAGVREKKIAFLAVKVYSVALYVDAAAAGAALKAGKTLLTGAFDKAICIKMAMKVDGPTFWKALDEALMPRIAQLATDAATAENDEGNFMADVAEAAEKAEEAARSAAKALGEMVMGQSLEAGTELLLRWVPSDDSLKVSVAGGAEKSFQSKELCKALFDVYLGSDPVSPPALQAFQSAAKAL